jgi:hypothetical protein
MLLFVYHVLMYILSCVGCSEKNTLSPVCDNSGGGTTGAGAPGSPVAMSAHFPEVVCETPSPSLVAAAGRRVGGQIQVVSE